MARGLKFRIKEVEGLYYLCSENKGADQLRGYREADLCLCFAYAKSWFSHNAAHLQTTELWNLLQEASPLCGTKREEALRQSRPVVFREVVRLLL